MGKPEFDEKPLTHTYRVRFTLTVPVEATDADAAREMATKKIVNRIGRPKYPRGYPAGPEIVSGGDN